MNKTGMALNVRTHGILAIAALIALVGMGASARQHLQAALTSNIPVIVDMAIEHTEPVSISLEMSHLKGQSLVQLKHNADERIKVSIPESWQRSEVRGAQIADIESEPPALGFVRWHIPPNASITYKVLNAPDNILLHNPSKVPLKIQYALVDLNTEEVKRDTVLVQKDAVMLW